jgi:hypothetical protein
MTAPATVARVREDGTAPVVLPRSRTSILALAILASAITSAAVTFALQLVRPAPVRFATLNVAQLFTERQEELMKLVADGTGEAGAQKAMDLARDFGRQLEAEALALPRECHCVVLVRGAVVAGGDFPDFTDAVRARLKRR